MKSRGRWITTWTIAAASLTAGDAGAHFHLLSPPSWTVEDALGDPQKSSPCGGENGTPTGTVTTFRPGQTISVEWVDTVYHPGHFRIALAADRAQLQEPMVTTDQNGVSISATIESPPVLPVLLDNLFPRTAANGTPGTMFQQDVVLPDMQCAKCTLQVIQFMADHGPPNYIYHHCADLQLANDSPDGAAADLSPAADAAGGDGGGGGGGCGCRVAARQLSSRSAWLLVALLATLRTATRSRRKE